MLDLTVDGGQSEAARRLQSAVAVAQQDAQDAARLTAVVRGDNVEAAVAVEVTDRQAGKRHRATQGYDGEREVAVAVAQANPDARRGEAVGRHQVRDGIPVEVPDRRDPYSVVAWDSCEGQKGWDGAVFERFDGQPARSGSARRSAVR